MKRPTSVLSILACVISPALALTESDLSPAAIAGKTLTFTIETGASPLATTGSWTGAFGASPGNRFTMTRVTGDTVNSTGIWSYNSTFAGMYEYTLKPFVAGQPDGYLTLWISGGNGRYEVYLNGLFGKSQTGGFTIGAPTAGPEIAVLQPTPNNLTDGKSKKNFGRLKVGKKGPAKTFTIKNTGSAKLTGLAVGLKGKQKGSFNAGGLGKTTLAPGASTTFEVFFKPTAKGTRTATLQIYSNDADENPFDVQLTGEGAKR